jgi:hypothetical protein
VGLVVGGSAQAAGVMGTAATWVAPTGRVRWLECCPPRGRGGVRRGGRGDGARGVHDEPKAQVMPPRPRAAVGRRKKRNLRTTSARNHVNQTKTQTQVFKHRRREGAPAQLVVPCETTHGEAVFRRQWGAANLH